MTERDIFLAALDKETPAERAAFVDGACGGDAELRQRVGALLAAHDAADSFLQKPAAALHATSEFTPEAGNEAVRGPILAKTTTYQPAAGPGAVIAGRYLLAEKIGEGGMGEVWVAKQTEPVKRKVALKLIKAGMDSKAVVQRFEQERQALALMDHPHIAKVLDGGLTDDRHPYFVMELVNGLPLTRFCDEAKLTPRERLQLFVPVCQAVQHAHQKGIVHRDLKPSNILVTLIDGTPVPKVIDFGVAKAIGGKLTEESLSTQFGAVVGTLEYMAPEQAGYSGVDIDTRADIYSLGVILYELLTGLRPHDGQRLRKAALAEMIRIIQEEEPSKPSTRLSTDAALPSLAASRQTEPKKLMAMLRGELDWVIMKCLEKQRERRYETASSLARDIQRYLADEPVDARPPSLSYRAGKFLRRNKVPAIAAAAAIAALLVGTAVAIWQAIIATEAKQDAFAALHEKEQARAAEAAQRKRAEANEKAASEREAESKAVLAFVEGKIFAAARPEGQQGGLGREVTLRQAIEAALPFVENSFANQPLIEARLRRTLGVSFSYLGANEAAAAQDERARALYAKYRGSDDPDTVSCVANLANDYEALGRHQEALALREAVLALRKSQLGPVHPDTLTSLSHLATSYQLLARYEEALKIRQEVVAVRKANPGLDGLDLFLDMDNLAISYESLGQHAEALRLREETLPLVKTKLPPDHPTTLNCMNNLALSYETFGRLTEAFALRKEVLARREAKLGPDHRLTLRAASSLASSLDALGRRDEGIRLREKTLARMQAVLPRNHPDTLHAMHNLAIGYASLGRKTDALRLFEETVSLMDTVLGPDHADTLMCKNNLAVNYSRLGRDADALELRQAILGPMRTRLGANHPETLWVMGGVAENLVKLNRGAEALPIIDECFREAKGKVVDPNLLPVVLELRLRYFERTKDAAGCRQTAAMWEALNRTGDPSLYRAAFFRAVTAAIVKSDPTTPAMEADRLAKVEADQAMIWLRQAVGAGFRNAAVLKQDPHLDALRDREDFKKLLAELEAANAKPATTSRKEP